MFSFGFFSKTSASRRALRSLSSPSSAPSSENLMVTAPSCPRRQPRHRMPVSLRWMTRSSWTSNSSNTPFRTKGRTMGRFLPFPAEPGPAPAFRRSSADRPRLERSGFHAAEFRNDEDLEETLDDAQDAEGLVFADGAVRGDFQRRRQEDAFRRRRDLLDPFQIVDSIRGRRGLLHAAAVTPVATDDAEGSLRGSERDHQVALS